MEPANTPLVALHGFMGNGQSMATHLAGLSREVVAFDLPGHGSSDSSSLPDPAQESWFDASVNRIEQVLDQSGYARIDLVGYSLGGRVAMHLAIRMPERIRRLVLESSHPGSLSDEERAARWRSDTAWAERWVSSWPHALHEWYDQPVFQSLVDTGHFSLTVQKSLRQTLIAEKSTSVPEEVARAHVGFSVSRQKDLTEALISSGIRTLFVSGELDSRYRAIGERLQARSGLIEHQSISGAGHIVHRENPGAYLEALSSFLES